VVGQDHKIFTVEELEELMCGKNEVDVGDWRDNTEYKGAILTPIQPRCPPLLPPFYPHFDPNPTPV